MHCIPFLDIRVVQVVLLVLVTGWVDLIPWCADALDNDELLLWVYFVPPSEVLDWYLLRLHPLLGGGAESSSLFVARLKMAAKFLRAE